MISPPRRSEALIERHAGLASAVDEVFFGCANQAGEDNRNVARMASLLAGLPESVPGVTLNRLCASGLDAVGMAARSIRAGDIDVAIAGGVESMTRAPMVMGKATEAFSRSAEIFDTTIGWRFVNPLMKKQYGIDSMPETAENVAEDFQIGREAQDAFALRSQQRAARAREDGFFAGEIVPVTIPGRTPVVVALDEHPRADTTMESLAKLKNFVRDPGTVTAGNASGVNDGAAALVLASASAAERLGLTPMARVLGLASAGVAPRVMGMGPVPAVRRLLERAGLALGAIDAIELNEAFASQGIACLRQLGLAEDAAHVNPNGRRHRSRPSARHVRSKARRHAGPPAAPPGRPIRYCDDVPSAWGRASRWRLSASDVTASDVQVAVDLGPLRLHLGRGAAPHHAALLDDHMPVGERHQRLDMLVR